MANIISRSELDRIRKSVLPEYHDDYKARRRQELKKLSEDRLKHWPNTLEATRAKKLSFVAEKEKREEEARMEIDRKEAELRRTMRLEAIKRANALMYEQTDKMKMLKSQKLYAEVVQDRFKQMEEKKKAKIAEKEWGKQFHEAILKRVADGEAEEEEKKRKKEEQIKIMAVVRKEQVDDVMARRAAEAAEARAIGESMKERAAQLLLDEHAAFEAKKVRIAESNAAMVVANERLKVVRQEIMTKEREAEAERDAEKEVIENRKKALKALEARRFAKAQESRQKIIDAAVKQLAAKSNQEQTILLKQENELKEKQDKAFADKAAKFAAQEAAIRQSRTEMMETKERLAQKQFEDEERLIKLWAEGNQAEIDKEKAKIQREHEQLARLKALQYAEGQAAARRKLEGKVIEMQQAKILQEIGQQDDDKFAEVCKEEIAKFAAAGKPVYTLMRALQNHQPDLLAARIEKGKREKK